MTKAEKIARFDPNGLAMGKHIYGLPFGKEDAEVIILPVPWDVTVSYTGGASLGPEAVWEASRQVDLFDPFVEDAWQLGLWMTKINPKIRERSEKYREKAVAYLDALAVDHVGPVMQAKLDKVNEATAKMVEWVREECSQWMDQNKLVVLLGGDHSTPLGYLQALADRHTSFGILQIDAHADLRKSYEGFVHSHASIMYNALQIPQVEKLVQVGIRDYCQEEVDYIKFAGDRISTFYDRDLKHGRYSGISWRDQVRDIIADLPQNVYITFDIDGLDPKLCPNTGTPVAGGFEADEVLFLFEELARSGKRIIGMDLNEVAPGPHDDWDANVGGRLLYRMCNLMGRNNGRI